MYTQKGGMFHDVGHIGHLGRLANLAKLREQQLRKQQLIEQQQREQQLKKLNITSNNSNSTYFQTEPDKDIFALSDIHGDIHSFIIVLRDLAQVIRKKDRFIFDNNTYDADLERLLNIDISDDDGEYKIVPAVIYKKI